jgi:RNA polymerase sigma-70 factor (ECF subfamily)
MEESEVRPLVQRAQHGDDEAFAMLYAELAPRVLRYLGSQVRDQGRAEELMQLTFVKAIEGLPRYQLRDHVPFAAWIFRIARNAMIDDRRSARPVVGLDAVEQVPTAAAGPAELAEAASERSFLLDALDHLRPDQREVLIYRFFAELRPPEVARLMSRSEGAVRVLQHRALGALRLLLDGRERTETAGTIQ